METFDLISLEDMGAIRLKPFASIPRFLIIDSEFDKDRRLDSIPSTLVIRVNTSNGKTLQGRATLNIIQSFTDIKWHDGTYHPKKYLDKIRDPNPDIPF